MNFETGQRHSHGDGGGGNQSDESANQEDLNSGTATPRRTRSDLNVRKTRGQEAVSTLLSSFGDPVEQCSEEFTRQDIKFKDLSALSQQDLILLGIADPDTQSAMLDTFHELPNQEMHYDRLCKSADAQHYNERILERGQSHVNSMNTSLSAAYLKMRVNPSNDVIVDDSIFASRFVLEALDELKKVADNVEDRLRALEQVALRNPNVSKKGGRNLYKTLGLLTGMCTGVSLAYWYWKGH